MKLMPRAVLLLLAAAALLSAQRNQVKWSLELEPSTAAPGGKVLGKLKASIDEGWHLYSLSRPKTPANVPTTITVVPNPAVAEVKVYQPRPMRAFDKNFNTETETYEREAVFLIEMQLKGETAEGPVEITAEPRYQVCSETTCIPPVKKSASATLTVNAAARAAAPVIPEGYSEPGKEDSAPAAPDNAGSQGLGAFLAVAFGVGLLAIFTPCVFPMIPITMSYFLNRPSGSRSDTIFHAALFCMGIVVLFSGLGLLATAALGPFGVVQIGSNPWVNGFIALVFLVFGLSLLGAFEITIPSSVLTRLDSRSQAGGVAGTLLMGLTFSLTSFACVGPFVGTLLAASVQGGGTRPLLGMVAFASGLSLPFFLLAVFPGYLKRMPKSGGWLARVKVVMGFVILAAMLKYLSSVDQVLQWNFLTRERFLAAWVVLFAMAGLYLLGYVRLEGIAGDAPLGLGRLLTGMALLIFAFSLVPGMFGARLGELDAYVPLAASQPGGAGAEGGGLAWMKNQFREAIERARREGKNVLVSFTGYACSNCHWMKANMFTRPEVAAGMQNFILVELYTDGADAASEENQKLQEGRFKTIAIPYYAIFDGNENVLATFAGVTRDSPQYLAFLQKGAQPAPSAPDLTLTRLDGSPYDLSALKGKVAVVNFWATWCVPCVREIPAFNRMHKELGPKGVVILGISMDEEGAAKVKPFLAKYPMAYDVALGSEKLGEAYKIDQLPVTLVLDRAGRTVKRFEGFTEPQAIEEAIRSAG